jgi:phosphate-selective porin OprO and OprP
MATMRFRSWTASTIEGVEVNNDSILYQLSFLCRYPFVILSILTESRLKSLISVFSKKGRSTLGEDDVILARMLPAMVMTFCVFLTGEWIGSVRAQDTQPPDAQAAKIAELERRVKELEELVRRVENKASQPQAPLPAGQLVSVLQEGSNPIPQDMRRLDPAEYSSPGYESGTAGWNKGFFMQSADKAHTLRITGQIQTDYRSFQNDNDTTDIDTFLLRRARLGIEATMFNYYEFRFLPDFGGSSGSKAVIQDSYLNIHYVDAVQFQVGKFKEPVSYEQLVQDRYVVTMERSLFDQIVPARDIGAMIHGQKLLGDQVDYAIGVFNGEINGGSTPADQDTNKLRDFAARVAWRPLNYQALPDWLHLLQIGISGTTGVEKEAMNPLTLRTPGTVPFFTFNSTVVADGLRTRWTPEVSYFYRGLGVAAQYLRMDQQLRPSATGAGAKLQIDLPFTGYYGMVTYLLTGEQRTTYSMAVEPLRPFEPLHPFSNPGAWELVTRFSHLDVGDQVFAPGLGRLADPTKFSNSASELTVGFNWYLNSLVRMQFNWEHAWFGQPVLLGPPKTSFSSSNTLLARLQVIF